MPTGYTCIIEDDPSITFRKYALRCARGMGVCVMQRDDDMADPPKPRELTDYHSKAANVARARLVELQGLSAEGAAALWQADVESARKANEQFIAEATIERDAYSRIRAEVVAWSPPTPDHSGLRKFMLEQIDLCYRPDELPYQQAVPATCAEWLRGQIDRATHDIAYHDEHHAAEVRHVEESARWIEALYASLPTT